MNLEQYQQDALAAALDAYWIQGVTRQVIHMATGAGKTVTAAALAHAFLQPEERCLFLAHKDDLLTQAMEEWEPFFSPREMGRVQARYDAYGMRIIFGSQMTLKNPERLTRLLSRGDFRLVIIDETHHAVSPVYRKIIERVVTPNTFLVGLTATPTRADGQSLRKVFQERTFSIGTLELIAINKLCDIQRVIVTTDLDLSGVDEDADGDFNEAQLAVAVSKSKDRYHGIIRAIKQYARHKQGIFFGASVEDAKQFSSFANAAGITCRVVIGKTKDDEREEIKHQFNAGEIQYIANVGVLTEGSNYPRACVGVIGRHTQSPELYAQIIGRIIRILPEDRGKPPEEWVKKFGLIIDVADNHHRVMVMTDLLGTTEERMGTKSVKKMLVDGDIAIEPAAPTYFDPKPVKIKAAGASVYTQNDWIAIGNDLICKLPGVGTLRAEYDLVGYRPVFVSPDGKVKHLMKQAVRAELACGFAEQYAQELAAKESYRYAQRTDDGVRAHPASEKQQALMRKLHLPAWDGMTAGHIQDFLDQHRDCQKRGELWVKSPYFGRFWGSAEGAKVRAAKQANEKPRALKNSTMMDV